MFKLNIFVLFFVLKCSALQDSNPIVQTEDGKLEGVWLTTSENRKYAAFRGVPFAAPPVGELRFEDPQPVIPWSGVRNATVFGPQCIQLAVDKTEGEEDCLHLNIYTPNLSKKAKLSTLVFIHGGDFMYGTGNWYDPVGFMNYDMVLVTLNFRLGSLGLFSTGDDVVAGNAQLKDQAFALHWIKRNIGCFGGDPNSVTLSGHSTGAASVGWHYLSPLSQGTFQKGIAFSGSVLASWALDDYPIEKGRTLAGLVGCPHTTNREMVKCLKGKPAEDIVLAQYQMREELGVMKIFQPTIESKKVRRPFFAEHPYFAAIAGKMSRIPFMMTTTQYEGLLPAAVYTPKELDRLEERWSDLASYILDYNRTLSTNRSVEVAQKIKDFYFDGKPISVDQFWPLVRVVTDRIYQAYIGQLAEIHANHHNLVYVYKYSFTGAYSFTNFFTNNKVVYGAAHTDDLLHLFYLFGFNSTLPADIAMNTVLGDIVNGFVTTGVPKLPENTKWDPMAHGCKEVQYLEIASPTDFKMKSSRDFGNRTFWARLRLNENENYRGNLYDFH